MLSLPFFLHTTEFKCTEHFDEKIEFPMNPIHSFFYQCLIGNMPNRNGFSDFALGCIIYRVTVVTTFRESLSLSSQAIAVLKGTVANRDMGVLGCMSVLLCVLFKFVCQSYYCHLS